MNKKSSGNESQVRVGNIQNSTGVAIGNEASAVVNQYSNPTREEVGGLLDEFIRSLELYSGSLDDAQSVRQGAVTVRAEVAQSSPRWEIVRRRLKAIAVSVAGVATLTDAINNIQVLVARIVN